MNRSAIAACSAHHRVHRSGTEGARKGVRDCVMEEGKGCRNFALDGVSDGRAMGRW